MLLIPIIFSYVDILGSIKNLDHWNVKHLFKTKSGDVPPNYMFVCEIHFVDLKTTETQDAICHPLSLFPLCCHHSSSGSSASLSTLYLVSDLFSIYCTHCSWVHIWKPKLWSYDSSAQNTFNFLSVIYHRKSVVFPQLCLILHFTILHLLQISMWFQTHTSSYLQHSTVYIWYSTVHIWYISLLEIALHLPPFSVAVLHPFTSSIAITFFITASLIFFFYPCLLIVVTRPSWITGFLVHSLCPGARFIFIFIS